MYNHLNNKYSYQIDQKIRFIFTFKYMRQYSPTKLV